MTQAIWYDRIEAQPPDAPDRLVYYRSQTGEKLSEDVRKVKLLIDETALRISSAFLIKSERKNLFSNLEEIAGRALCGKDVDLSIATDEIKLFRQHIATRAASIRDEYVKEMQTCCLYLGFASIVVILIWAFADNNIQCLYKLGFRESFVATSVTYFGAAGFAMFGISISACLIAYIQNRDLTYDNIHKIRKYSWNPSQYLLYISMLCTALFIILAQEVVMIGLGGRLLNSVSVDAKLGILVGTVCAVSEAAVALLVSENLRPIVQNRSSPSDHLSQ